MAETADWLVSLPAVTGSSATVCCQVYRPADTTGKKMLVSIYCHLEHQRTFGIHLTTETKEGMCFAEKRPAEDLGADSPLFSY